MEEKQQYIQLAAPIPQQPWPQQKQNVKEVERLEQFLNKEKKYNFNNKRINNKNFKMK
ncbi:unnamed protein product [Paramecium primaurelia]|uniref:Uncharacterized protein n=1 Tax=Paramecium primaurelia TaxID=5886 RepID=A0A8S1JTT5_PARPR|nr:unnamed protein product [Paramecium primaurelia]